jgi:hypothetical protein
MHARSLAVALAALLSLAVSSVWAQTCSTAGTAAASAPFWLQNIQHQGIAPYSQSPSSYKVYRNVKDYGAKGDGVTVRVAARRSLPPCADCGAGRHRRDKLRHHGRPWPLCRRRLVPVLNVGGLLLVLLSRLIRRRSTSPAIVYFPAG